MTKITNPNTYRAGLSCKLGRDALEGKLACPPGVTPMEWAMYNLLHAVDDLVQAVEGIQAGRSVDFRAKK